jgi:GMP synthase-like glutamine amidotransferase
MRALFIEHDHVSPPGPVADRLVHHGFTIDEVVVVTEPNFKNPNVTFDFPNPDEYDLLIPMGAPWGAWDDGCIGNWLQPELDLFRAEVSSGKPVLGICFGGQLIARAMGGSVAPGPKAEIGWTSIFSDEQDIVSDGPWFQFHYDKWVVPPGAREIARNPVASQAYIINKTLGLQFHPEIDEVALKQWLDWGGDREVLKDGQDPDVMLSQTRAFSKVARERTYALVDGFLSKVAGLI